MEVLSEICPSSLRQLEEYLKTKKLQTNKYRTGVGDGRSQCFGMVRKRSLAPDLSRQSWLDPYLHHLLMEFGRLHVPIPFTSVQVNQDYKCAEHRDKHNSGMSYIIGFGDYAGGDLILDLSGTKTKFNIKYKPLLFNGGELLHSTDDFTGHRTTLVYHSVVSPTKFPAIRCLSDYEAVAVNGHYLIAMRVPGEPVKYLGPKSGLPHPLKGRKKIQALGSIQEEDKKPLFVNAAQNLLANALSQSRDEGISEENSVFKRISNLGK